MFTCKICGVKTDHNKGFIFNSTNKSCYYFLYFLTPFFCEIDGVRVTGNAGDCIIHKKGDAVIHGPINDSESFINNWLIFDCEDSDVESLNLTYNKIFSAHDDKIFSSIITNIMKEDAISDEFSKQTISNYIYQLLIEFKRRININTNEEKSNFEKLNYARTHVLSRYGINWTLNEMAKLVGFSVSRFCALYKSFFNQSPMNDLLNKRLEASKQLLLTKAYKIADISIACGFSSQHYFTKFFKMHTGKSPREYMQGN